MIVTFRPTINNTADYTACYLNFLRCVTAIATAAAGTTSLTVNPYTASNTIDSTKNCIISIDANTEAGGWTTSASHAVPSSGNNTPTAYTALNSVASVTTYKADFYNASSKSTYPYKKLCFHTYSVPSLNYADNAWCAGTSNYTMHRGSISANKGANMLITFGCSSTSDWTSTTFTPTEGSNPNTANTTSYTLGGNTSNNSQNSMQCIPGLVYTDTSVEYHMAVTADYCVIWESKVGDTYTNGYFTTTTTGNGTTYWNGARYGSVYYMGLREIQPWEASSTSNVPWVCWETTVNTFGAGYNYQSYSGAQVAAWMLTIDNNGVSSSTPVRKVNSNTYANNNFHNVRNNSTGSLDGPLFQLRQCGTTGNNSYNDSFTSSNMLYMPQYDTVTGLWVPGAYPIKISSCVSGAWNPGGACKGLYKSLSMPYANMKQYWQASNQTFTIGSDTYLPFVINTDMWLVRYA